MKVCHYSGIKNSLRKTYQQMTNLWTTRPKIQELDTWESAINWEQIIHTGCISSKNHEKGKIATGLIPDYYIKKGNWSDHYYIDQLFGDNKGAGTRQVQKIVLQSLKDSQTRGRVLLEAASIDGYKTHPAGFYYKLGFRHTCEDFDLKLAKWLKEGGKKENAPWCYGNMYLPQENIMQCLTYGNTFYSLKDMLLIKSYMLRNKILFAIDK